MRNATWKAPTGIRPKNRICSNCNTVNLKKAKTCKNCKESLSYQGAMVYDPLSEGTNGLHHGVAAFDFAGLYPSMILARNISFETISDTPTEFGAGFGWSNVTLAESITASAREAIRLAAFKAKEMEV